MLIFRYLLKETLKAQLAVFLVLMAIFITQRFVRVLTEATNGDIPAAMVWGFLALKMPVLASLILPLSLFLGIMLAHGRLYIDSEMTVMRACGISEWYVTRITLVLALCVTVITGLLTLWIAPLAVEKEYQLEEQVGADAGLSTIVPGRFQQTANQKAVLFVHDVNNKQLQKVFVAQQEKDSQAVQIVYAQTGKVTTNSDGSQQLILNQGNQYEGELGRQDYQTVNFDQYQVQIAEQEVEQKRRKLEAYNNQALLDEGSVDAIAELQWRIAIPLSLPLLVLIAVPLSAVDPRKGRFGKMFPALLLYLGYFLLLMAGRKILEEGKIPPAIGLWWVHGLIGIIGAILVLKGRTFGVRLRSALSGKA